MKNFVIYLILYILGILICLALNLSQVWSFFLGWMFSFLYSVVTRKEY